MPVPDDPPRYDAGTLRLFLIGYSSEAEKYISIAALPDGGLALTRNGRLYRLGPTAPAFVPVDAGPGLNVIGLGRMVIGLDVAGPAEDRRPAYRMTFDGTTWREVVLP